jgi:hypothetical protein
MTDRPFWEYPRHLGKQVARALIAYHPEPVSTSVLLDWAYGPVRKPWHTPNLHCHLRAFGYKPVGQTKSQSHTLLWSLRKLEDGST